jgi:hypothetical protein
VTKQGHRPGELPGWVKAGIFAATLLAVSWLAMWMESASRRG